MDDDDATTGTGAEPDDERSPLDRLLDVVLFAPLGFALDAPTLVPQLVERGRRTVETQVRTARVLGQFAVAQGRREVERRLADLRPTVPTQPGPPPSPSPSEATDATDATDATAPTAPEPDVVLAEPEVSEPEPAPAPAPPGPHHDRVAAADLAIPDYDSLAASQVVPRLAGLTPAELDAVARYEAAHRGRRTILARVAQLQAGR